MRIVMFSSSLGGGGAERSLVVLADGLRAAGHEVVVVTYMEGVPDFYQLGKGIKRVHLRLGKYQSIPWFDIWGNLRRLQLIRRCLKRQNPHVMISFLDGTNEFFLLATLFWRVPKVISCQVDVRFHPSPNRRWYFLRSAVYPLADRIVFLDKEQARWCRRHFLGWNTIGIPNPVAPIPDKFAPCPVPGRMKKNLVAMGRLDYQKGFDLLIQSFSKIAPDNPEWGLVILGEGPLRPQLEKQIRLLGLSERVFLPGAIPQPFSILGQCDIFVFSSRYEGQGMALIEAMACGLPSVSFDCPSGPSHIVKHEIDGFLVPLADTDAFAKAMERLMRDEKLRLRMGQKAKEVIKRFGCEKTLCRWFKLFEEIRCKTQ